MTALVLPLFVAAAVLAFVAGALGGYGYYRARHREALDEAAAVDRELAAREAELQRPTPPSAARLAASGDGAAPDLLARCHALRDELEQRDLDLAVLRQDYDEETRLLRQEIEQLHAVSRGDYTAPRRQLDAERAALDAEAAELDARHAQLEAQQRRLRDRLEQSERAHQEAEQLRQELERAWQEVERGRQEAERRRLESERARQEAERSRQRVAEQSEQLAARDASAAALEARLAAASAEAPPDPLLVRRLRQQIHLLEAQVEELRMRPVQPSPRPRPQPAPPPSGDAGGPPAAPRPALPTFSPLASLLGLPRSAPPPQRRSVRFDPLTRIPGITDAVQAQLFEMGFTTFEQLARLSSADVRRIAERLGVDRRAVQEQWILEAQTRVFEPKTP